MLDALDCRLAAGVALALCWLDELGFRALVLRALVLRALVLRALVLRPLLLRALVLRPLDELLRVLRLPDAPVLRLLALLRPLPLLDPLAF